MKQHLPSEILTDITNVLENTNNLLETIKIPKNLYLLKEQLPKP